MQATIHAQEHDDSFELTASDRRRIGRINTSIRLASRSLRERHRWLRHQDAIGLCILLASAGAMLGLGWAFARGALPAAAVIVLAAMAASIAHEIEHDLIHKLYFRNRPWANAAMMALGWLLRPNTINPWIRRRLHLKHHQLSGTEKDLEERAITNGEPFGVKRVLMMADGVLAVLLRLDQAGDRKRKVLAMAAASYFPLGWLHFSLWYAFLAAHAALTLGFALPEALAGVLPQLDFVVTVWLAPNVLRSFCINFVSSSMHYYGDVEPRNVLQQTQILDTPWLLPLQLFCFNFGGTHAIHHFVANEPFYVRQWTAREARTVMLEEGVPRNDLGTFRRANRRGEPGDRQTRAHAPQKLSSVASA